MHVRAAVVGLALVLPALSPPVLCSEEEPSRLMRALRLMVDPEQPRRQLNRTLRGQGYLMEESDGALFQLAVGTVGQWASESLTERQGLTSITYDFAGAWRFFDNERTRGSLSWWLQGSTRVLAPQDASLTEDIGSILGINDLLSDEILLMKELYWVQSFGDTSAVSFGRFDPSFRFDINAAANDDHEQFLNSALVNSQGIPFPSPGVGITWWWEPDDSFRVNGGVFQDNCDSPFFCVQDVNERQLFFPVEAAYSVEYPGMGRGSYRFLLYFRQTGESEGGGFSLSFDQELGRLVPFFRYSHGNEAITEIESFLSLGLGVRDPFGRTDDYCGVGWAWSEPSSNENRREQVVELFYRFEISSFLAITPDLQFVIDPARNPVDDRITVVGVRLQGSF